MYTRALFTLPEDAYIDELQIMLIAHARHAVIMQMTVEFQDGIFGERAGRRKMPLSIAASYRSMQPHFMERLSVNRILEAF